MKKKPLIMLSAMSLLVASSAHASMIWGVNGHEYDIVPAATAPISWSAANAAVPAGGWHLATITSAAENAFIVASFPTAVTGGYWLGGTQPAGSAEPAGGWTWVTGEAWSYTNWEPTIPEPNNSGGEDSLHFDTFTSGGGTWNDLADANARSGYVIERPARMSVPDGGTSGLLLLCSVGSLLGIKGKLKR